jgi:tryptophan 2,3-dioxygenase
LESKKPLTYSSYLKLEELLSLQQPKSSDHDEMLFIIIHQSYEIWFKEILHEIDFLKILLAQNSLPRCLHTMKRILTILKIMVAKIDILETMTPLEFLTFRDRLDSASGFQSFQFRELEFVLGFKDEKTVHRFPEGSSGRQKIEKRFHEKSLWDSFLHFLSGNNYPVPDEILKRDVTRSQEPSNHIQKILIDVYQTDPAISQLCELFVDLDEGFQEWRYRHVKMVERTIGTKKGTGGSEGVQYLSSTLFKPFFPDLWIIRKDLQKK